MIGRVAKAQPLDVFKECLHAVALQKATRNLRSVGPLNLDATSVRICDIRLVILFGVEKWRRHFAFCGFWRVLQRLRNGEAQLFVFGHFGNAAFAFQVGQIGEFKVVGIWDARRHIAFCKLLQKCCAYVCLKVRESRHKKLKKKAQFCP